MNVGVVTSTEFNTSKSVSDTEATSVSITSSVSASTVLSIASSVSIILASLKSEFSSIWTDSLSSIANMNL